MLNINTPSFPSHQGPKGRDFITKTIKACWDDFNSQATQSFYAGRTRYATLKRYAIGEQDIKPYLDLYGIDDANASKSWLKSTKKILSIVPKYRRMMISTLLKNVWGVDVQAIDPTSKEEKNEFYARNLARLELKKAFEEQGLDPNMIPDTDAKFESNEDLDLYMEYTYKNAFAIDAEEVVKVILNNNKYEDNVREQGVSQLVDLGAIAYKDFFDQNGDVKIRHVDINNVIVSRCKNNDFSDAQYIGEVVDLTFADVKEMDVDSELSEDDYNRIEHMQKSGSYMVDTNSRINPKDYENYRCQVLDIEFYSTNSIILEKGRNKYGNPTVSRKKDLSKKSKDNEYDIAEYKVVYEGKWVVGTDIFFGCKLQTNMKRASNNLSDVALSFHINAPNLSDLNTKSILENMIPIADQIQLTWMKYSDVIITAQKSGIAIEIGALENIPLGKGGTALTAPGALDFYKKTGSLIYRRLDEAANGTWKPIEQLDNGIKEEASRYFNEIQNQISLLQQLTGYNEITDGSTPNERTLNGVAKLAADSTNNSIDFMKRAERIVVQSLYYSLILRVQDLAAQGLLRNYTSAIGENSVNFFSYYDASPRELGMVITEAPSEFRKQILADRINLAIQSGQITIADAFMVENIPNVKHAEALLAIRIKKFMDYQQKQALENSQMQAKIQEEAAITASNAKMQELEMENAFKIQLTQAETEKELMILDRKYGYELQLKEMEVSGRIEGNRLVADAKTYQADRQSKTKETEHFTQMENDNRVKEAEMEQEKEMEKESE
jgi:hypothetical protein